MMPMSHESIVITSILEDLPPETKSALQAESIKRGIPLTVLVKEGLLKVAEEISSNKPVAA